MVTILVGGALLTAAAYAAWKLFQYMRDRMNQSAPSANGGESEQTDESDQSNSGASKDQKRKEEIEYDPAEERRKLLENIVASVQFAQMVRRTVEEKSSEYPAETIAIRPMHGFNEIGRLTAEMYAAEDDVFFGQVAAGKAPVVEYRKEEVTESKVRSALVVVQDRSPSMKDAQRIRWALQLNQRLLDRCQESGVEYILIPFAGYPGSITQASRPEQYQFVRNNLSKLLYIEDSTNIDAALKAAMDFIERERFEQARILLVTDGTEGIRADETQQRLADLGVLLHTVCIGVPHTQLESISARYDLVPDIEEI